MRAYERAINLQKQVYESRSVAMKLRVSFIRGTIFGILAHIIGGKAKNLSLNLFVPNFFEGVVL